MNYALDANTLILFFSNNSNVCKNIEEKEKNNVILIPPMTYYEVLRGFLNIGAAKKTEQLKAMYYNSYNYIQIPENDTFEKGAYIYAELSYKGFTVGSNDIIIAAWCILTNSILITNNTNDFKNIDNLVIEDWK